MVPNSVRYPVPFPYAFLAGALFLGVDKQVDYERDREIAKAMDRRITDATGGGKKKRKKGKRRQDPGA